MLTLYFTTSSGAGSPYTCLDHLWEVHVNIPRSVATSDTVVVDLRTGTARPNVSHFPKVVGRPKGEDTLRR